MTETIGKNNILNVYHYYIRNFTWAISFHLHEGYRIGTMMLIVAMFVRVKN